MPSDDAGVPDQPARIVAVRPDFPADFNKGDPIQLFLDLDRQLTALECRVIDDQGLSGWTAYPGINYLKVDLFRIHEGTLGELQNLLDEVNSAAANKAQQADVTRSLLSRLIDGWGM